MCRKDIIFCFGKTPVLSGRHDPNALLYQIHLFSQKQHYGFSEGSLVNLFSFSINSIIFMDIMLGQGQVGKRQKKAAEDPRPHIQMTTVCLLQPRNYGQSSHSQG